MKLIKNKQLYHKKINDNKDELTALQADFDKASTEEADAAAKKAADDANNAKKRHTSTYIN